MIKLYWKTKIQVLNQTQIGYILLTPEQNMEEHQQGFEENIYKVQW